MSGIEGEAGRAWAERNGLTPSLAFSHNLAAVFPPALHAQHPEFFPLVNGERLRPRDGANNWNPDLGREDVAAWAAEAARRHFDAHPESESFSVGVNDGLIFGDSAETMAALRVWRKPESGKLRPESGPRRPETGNLKPETRSRKPKDRTAGVSGRSAEVSAFASSPAQVSGLKSQVSVRNPLPWFRGRPDLSNLVFGFTNRAARDVGRTHPGKYVGALAYYWCENAPDFPLEPNVIPFLTADRSQGYDENFRREELALQRRWASVKRKPETRNLIPEIGNPRAEHQAARESREARETKTEVNADRVSGFSSQASAGTPGVEGNRTKREAKGRGASDLSTLRPQRSTSDEGGSARETNGARSISSQGRSAHETHGTHEKEGKENERVAAGSALRSIQSPGEDGNRTKREETNGDGASALVTLSSQHSTADQARTAHGTHGIHETGEEADAAQVSGFGSQVSAGAERRLGLYDYLYGSGFLIPRIHTRLIDDNLRQARRLGFTDYFAEVNPNWGLDGPMPWLVAQLLQDPEQSREVLLEEYYQGCFGEAAVPMRRFFERCERQWMHQPGPAYWLKHYRNESQARLFPSAVCRELRALLDEAARQARGGSVQARVNFVSDAFGVTERFVAFCEARDALNRAVLTREMGLTGNQGRVAHETRGTHEYRREEIEPMAPGSALRSIQPPDEDGDRTKREETYGDGASALVTLSSQLSTLSQGRSARETYEVHENQRGENKTVAAGSALRSIQPPGRKPSRVKERETSGLSTLSSQLSTTDQGQSAHGTHEKQAETDAAQVSGFSSQVSAGARYLAAREEFIDYTKALMAREPQALAPFRWEDYLRHEPPLGDGERWTVDGGQWTVDGRQWTVGCGRWTVDDAGRPENLLSNGDLHGPLRTPKRVAGLDYGVAMPEGWITTVEPAERQTARLEDGVLRLERNKETFVYQWLPAMSGAEYRATVQVRGRVQPSATASLTLSWLDERQAPLGFKMHRLPEGAWPEWVTLEVVQDLPAAARWIGTGVRVQHQLEGDWLEVRAVRLERVR